MNRKINVTIIDRACYNGFEGLHIDNKIIKHSKLPLSITVVEICLELEFKESKCIWGGWYQWQKEVMEKGI